jgi:hypothetical protein
MKYSLLAISFIGSGLLLAILYTDYGKILQNLVNWRVLEVGFNLLLIFPVALFFSLLTFKLPDRMYQSWVDFAQLAIPLACFTIMLISLGFFHQPTPGSGGWLPSLNQIVNVLFIILTLFLFTLGSLIQIYRGYIHSTGGLIKLFGFLLGLGIAIPVITLYVLG